MLENAIELYTQYVDCREDKGYVNYLFRYPAVALDPHFFSHTLVRIRISHFIKYDLLYCEGQIAQHFSLVKS